MSAFYYTLNAQYRIVYGIKSPATFLKQLKDCTLVRNEHVETDLYEWLQEDLLWNHTSSDLPDGWARTSGRTHSPSAVGVGGLRPAGEGEAAVAGPMR